MLTWQSAWRDWMQQNQRQEKLQVILCISLINNAVTWPKLRYIVLSWCPVCACLVRVSLDSPFTSLLCEDLWKFCYMREKFIGYWKEEICLSGSCWLKCHPGKLCADRLRECPVLCFSMCLYDWLIFILILKKLFCKYKKLKKYSMYAFVCQV